MSTVPDFNTVIHQNTKSSFSLTDLIINITDLNICTIEKSILFKHCPFIWFLFFFLFYTLGVLPRFHVEDKGSEATQQFEILGLRSAKDSSLP